MADIRRNSYSCVIIYMITCTLTSKVYVGQTWGEMDRRLADHKSKAKSKSGYCVKLEHAINKYGPDNFTIAELDLAASQKQADQLEDFYILAGDTIRNGYNIRRGGSHGKCSAETIAKMRAAKIGPKNSSYGKPLSAEHKMRISKAQTGKTRSIEDRKKQSKTLQPLNTDTKKYCPKCGQTKLFVDFYPRKQGSERILHHCCKVCEAERSRIKYLKSKSPPKVAKIPTK